MRTIRQLHALVGSELIENAGNLRQKQAMASGTGMVYAPAAVIEKRLEELVSWFNSTFSSCQGSLADTLILVAVFFSEFLFIHPFSNGNGRVARLLVNHLLRHHTNVPFSLFTDVNGRTTYLKVLEEAQLHNSMSGLLTYFLWSLRRVVANAVYLALED